MQKTLATRIGLGMLMSVILLSFNAGGSYAQNVTLQNARPFFPMDKTKQFGDSTAKTGRVMSGTLKSISPHVGRKREDRGGSGAKTAREQYEGIERARSESSVSPEARLRQDIQSLSTRPRNPVENMVVTY